MATVDEVPLATLVGWLDALLSAHDVRDYGPNGLQVEGRPQVRRVATGVTANLDFIEAAVRWGADLLVVHHGLFWDGAPVTVTGALGRRIRALVRADVSLAAYHLPLDAHPEVGNAAALARALGLGEPTPDFQHRGIPVGCIGTFSPAISASELANRVRRAVSPTLHHFAHGPERVARLGIVTGGAARDVRRAIDAGCDAYLTGEAGEYSQATAREEGIHFLAAGHHRTERFGPRALAERLAAEWPHLAVEFIDVDNPV